MKRRGFAGSAGTGKLAAPREARARDWFEDGPSVFVLLDDRARPLAISVEGDVEHAPPRYWAGPGRRFRDHWPYPRARQ